ncbi:MAG: hypothetical protein WCE83_13335 [Candidatus Baltobacteraceae bacterium]
MEELQKERRRLDELVVAYRFVNRSFFARLRNWWNASKELFYPGREWQELLVLGQPPIDQAILAPLREIEFRDTLVQGSRREPKGSSPLAL